MSSPDSPSELLAVAFVVESSNTVLEAWPQIVQSYVANLVKRLTDTHPNHKLWIAFVSYATADTVPSPIVCKKYFNDYKPVSLHMKEAPLRLGLGRSNSGGSRGMAALEGLVAAIELFDILSRACSPSSRSEVFHLFHVAASPPDTTKHPQWNSMPHLDFVTWDDLPLELTKRHIFLSCINIHSSISRFEELHAAVSSTAGGRIAPWFPLRPNDVVSLNGFPNQIQAPSLKRSGESSTPDAKRQRLTISDSLMNTGSTTVPPRESGSSPSGAILLLLQLANAPGVAPEVKSNLLGAMERLRHLEKLVQEARAVGNVEDAEKAQREFQKLSNSLNHQGEELRRRLSTGMRHSQSGSTSTSQEVTMSSTGGATIASSSSAASSSQVEVKPPQLIQHPLHPLHSAKSSTSPGLPTTAPVSAQIMGLQIIKMVEQQHQGSTNLPPILQGVSSQIMSGLSPQLSSTSTSTPVGHPNFSSKLTRAWAGSLTFRGVTPQGKRDVKTEVVASAQNAADCRADTWPETLTLVPPRENVAVSINDIQSWIQRHHPVLCVFVPNPHPQESESKTNDANYRQLVTLLWTRKLYALAAWTLPSGVQENNLLVFTFPNGTLGGAFFPLTGIPEMPKPLLPNALHQLSLLPPEQRNAVLNHMMRHKQAQTASHGSGPSHAGLSNETRPQVHSGIEDKPGGSVPHLQNTSILNQNLLAAMMANHNTAQLTGSLVAQQLANPHLQNTSSVNYEHSDAQSS